MDGHAAEDQVYIVKRLHKSLLRRPAIDKLGLVRRISAVVGTDSTPSVQFPDLFKGLGKLQGDYQIQLQEAAMQYVFLTPRCVTIPLMKAVKRELQCMEDLGVIAEVHKPTD